MVLRAPVNARRNDLRARLATLALTIRSLLGALTILAERPT